MADHSMSQTEQNKQLVRRYLDAFNDKDREALSDLVDDDVVEHGTHWEVEGFEEFMTYVEENVDIFADYTGSTETIVAEEDTVVVRYSVSGTHEGEYLGIQPTGREVEWTGIAMYRIDDGEIAEIWIESDQLGLLEQLGLVEPPAHLRL
ncbi:MAG: ester cyclase [Halobacteriales archaeon]